MIEFMGYFLFGSYHKISVKVYLHIHVWAPLSFVLEKYLGLEALSHMVYV